MSHNKKVNSINKLFNKKIITIVSFLSIIIFGFILYVFIGNEPVSFKLEHNRLVYVKPNTTVNKLSDKLKKDKIIRSKFLFNQKERIKSKSNSVKDGNYIVNSSWSLDKNIESLATPNSEDTKKEYFNESAKDAVKVGKKYHVLPSLILAQSAIESDWGTSQLAYEYNNYFGIKTTVKANGVNLPTTEIENGQEKQVDSYFLKCKNKTESFKSYAKTLAEGNEWNKNQFKDVVDAKNYNDAAQAIYNNHYSTDPEIGNKIIAIINKYHLDKYDKFVK